MAKKQGTRKKPTDVRYGEAVEEIEQILESIDRDEIDIDDLSRKVERAVELIGVCREKLRATELRVTRVLEGLETDAESAVDRPDEVPVDADDDPDPEADDDGGKDELPF